MTKENYYKIYGKESGKIAGAIKCEERVVKEVCEEINKGDVTQDILTYMVVNKEEGINIQKNLVKRVLEGRIEWNDRNKISKHKV